ncbi:MAG: putative Ig domain-containing protein [Rhodanobacteraceae bacterium]|nr:putative Ig domain-containing protein [Rhodanobacteraceae bacterium]
MTAALENPFADDQTLRQQARLAALRYRRRLPSAVVGEDYQAELSDQPSVRLLPGTRLPPGIRFDGQQGLSGVAAVAGSYVVEFAECGLASVRRWLLEVTDAPRLEIAREPLPAASVGSYLCTHLRLTNPSLPVIWSVSDGRLPPGLRLDAHSGRLYGVPTQAGVWCCSLRAQLGAGAARAPLAVVVRPTQGPRRVPALSGQGVLAELRMRHAGGAVPST